MAISPKPPIFPMATAPRKQERDFQVEHNEENGHEVVAHVELHTAVFEGFEAALIRRRRLALSS